MAYKLLSKCSEKLWTDLIIKIKMKIEYQILIKMEENNFINEKKDELN